MTRTFKCIFSLFILSSFFISNSVWASDIHHDLHITLDPDNRYIQVRDTVTLNKMGKSNFEFSLHPGLQLELANDSTQLTELKSNKTIHQASIVPKYYRVTLPAGENSFTLLYRGRISHELIQQTEDYARSSFQSPGMISDKGVYLSDSSYWYPIFNVNSLRFRQTITMPIGWHSISQGKRVFSRTIEGHAIEQWHSNTAQQEILLIAGKYTEYTSNKNSVQAMVFLREPNDALAKIYLSKTHEYIELYSNMLGEYPYQKFAMVENHWQTGYGMPSFTLLGSRVIRLPFIPYTSYPHEILHNWWGNGVYVDYNQGNWSEGLTSYLADHYFKEQRGRGGEYRRSALQKYTNYVNEQNDIALTEFKGRHSARSEAVGYGKTLMLFHMLRQKIGDDTFYNGLRSFYKHYKFRTASFNDVKDIFEQVSNVELDAFFKQWLNHIGAPQLTITDVRVESQSDQYTLSFSVQQHQKGHVYELQLPVAVKLKGRKEVVTHKVNIRNKSEKVRLQFSLKPEMLSVDPNFDVFRRLHPYETPPSISLATGSEQVLVVLPAKSKLKNQYRKLAKKWQQSKAGQLDIVDDNNLDSLPENTTIWLLGWNNRFRSLLENSLKKNDVKFDEKEIIINNLSYSPSQHSLVLMARHPNNPKQALGWLSADSSEGLNIMSRKLPYYGRYSYLAFLDATGKNILKGQWQVLESPLLINLN